MLFKVNNKRRLVLLLLTSISLVVASQPLSARGSRADVLISIPSEEERDIDYRKLYEHKLFVSKDDVARYLFLPGSFGTEKSVAISCSASRNHGAQKQCLVTSTIASGRLWNVIQEAYRKKTKVPMIKIRTRTAPLPESTATAIERLWRAAIDSAIEPPPSDDRLDSSSQIFSTIDSTGKMTRAEAYGSGVRNRMLIDLGERLITYCSLPVSIREQEALRIEARAKSLVKGFK
jgi:hypothetical protein